jgi:glycosyltransferase involved in cell wall biosynthesis
MKRVLYIVPHLSTGGMPEVLLKRINHMDFVEVGVIEWTNIDNDIWSIQKNQIKKEVHYYKTLPFGNKEICLEYIKEFSPDVIHFEEFPENHVWYAYDDSYDSTIDTLEKIHKFNVSIINTSHTSVFQLEEKKFRCDGYYLVTNYHKDVQYKNLLSDTYYIVNEHPFDVKEVTDTDRNHYINKLNLDRRKKHILIIGLFNSNKNQGYIFYLANLLGSDYHFHFLGQQSDTADWKSYWKPLMDKEPDNVFCYGEVNNVEEFIAVSDLVIHPSLFELNPTIFYESLSIGIPVIAFPLETYTYSSYYKYLNFFQFDNLGDTKVDAFNYEMKTSSLVYNLELIESVVGKNILVEDTIELFKNKIMNFYENV